MNKNETLLFLKQGLSNLWLKDSKLILKSAKEEAINHRLAKYLEDELSDTQNNGLNVDLEYNSDGEGKKKIRIKRKFTNIRPDIIFHIREINENNFLAIEVKINKTSTHDRNKLIGLMQPPYNYKYGAAISCMPKKDHFVVIFFYTYLNYIYEREFLIQKQNNC